MLSDLVMFSEKAHSLLFYNCAKSKAGNQMVFRGL